MGWESKEREAEGGAELACGEEGSERFWDWSWGDVGSGEGEGEDGPGNGEAIRPNEDFLGGSSKEGNWVDVTREEECSKLGRLVWAVVR